MPARNSAVPIPATASKPDVTTAISPIATAPIAGAPLRTRKEGVERLRAIGIPITLSTMNKLCCTGLGPEPAGVFGNRDVYHDDELLRWAQARIEAGKAAKAAVKANKAAEPPADDTAAKPRPRRGRRPKPRPDVDGTASDNMPSATTSVVA